MEFQIEFATVCVSTARVCVRVCDRVKPQNSNSVYSAIFWLICSDMLMRWLMLRAAAAGSVWLT